MYKKSALIIPASLVSFFFCFASLPSVTGKWNGELMTADSTKYPITYNFQTVGDSLTGKAKSQLGEFPIELGRLDTTGIHFKVTVSGLEIEHDGRVYQDSIGMNIKVNGSIVHCTLTRSTD